jgi:hypothetical protein
MIFFGTYVTPSGGGTFKLEILFWGVELVASEVLTADAARHAFTD